MACRGPGRTDRPRSPALRLVKTGCAGVGRGSVRGMSKARYQRRRNESVADDLHAIFVALPWWVPVPVAAVVGAVVWLVPPAVLHTSSQGWFGLGLVAALVVLLIGFGALLEKGRRRRMLAATQRLEDLRRLRWQDFEILVAEAFRRQGWSVSEVGGGGADGGVDLLLRRDGEVVGIQCKRWGMRVVGVEKVRELQGALGDHGASRGVFVCCGRFTAEAAAFARRRGMELVDGDGLLALLPAGEGLSGDDRARVRARDGGVRTDSFRTHNAGKGSVLPHEREGDPTR